MVRKSLTNPCLSPLVCLPCADAFPQAGLDSRASGLTDLMSAFRSMRKPKHQRRLSEERGDRKGEAARRRLRGQRAAGHGAERQTWARGRALQSVAPASIPPVTFTVGGKKGYKKIQVRALL